MPYKNIRKMWLTALTLYCNLLARKAKPMQNSQSENSVDLFSYEIKNNTIDSLQIGINAEKDIVNKLRYVKKSIKIISPYLSDITIGILDDRCREGISDIFLITTIPEKPDQDIFPLLKLLINKVKDDEYRPCYNTIFCKGSMLHVKLYIIDDETVFLGSYNFTSYGIFSNIETSIIINNQDTVQEFVQYFDQLYSSSLFIKWDVAELGKIIYPQPASNT
jgi:phosphatidylserine/phosphatidylglycerophosphate/cardiolipin synthase-like enzyme